MWVYLLKFGEFVLALRITRAADRQIKSSKGVLISQIRRTAVAIEDNDVMVLRPSKPPCVRRAIHFQSAHVHLFYALKPDRIPKISGSSEARQETLKRSRLPESHGSDPSAVSVLASPVEAAGDPMLLPDY